MLSNLLNMKNFIKNGGFTFARIVVIAVLVCAIVSGCGEVCDAPTYVNDAARGETEATFVKVYTRFSRNYTSGTMLTVEHDGHLWIIYSGYSFLHSPDCPCLKNKQPELRFHESL
jgi:hypothetical protein